MIDLYWHKKEPQKIHYGLRNLVLNPEEEELQWLVRNLRSRKINIF